VFGGLEWAALGCSSSSRAAASSAAGSSSAAAAEGGEAPNAARDRHPAGRAHPGGLTGEGGGAGREAPGINPRHPKLARKAGMPTGFSSTHHEPPPGICKFP